MLAKEEMTWSRRGQNEINEKRKLSEAKQTHSLATGLWHVRCQEIIVTGTSYMAALEAEHYLQEVGGRKENIVYCATLTREIDSA